MIPNDTGKPGLWLKSIGVEWFHHAGFVINRPRGSGDFLFLHTLTPSVFRLDGCAYEVKPGTCFVYSPGDPHWYGGFGHEPFGNDWFHFEGADVLRVLAEFEVPFCRAIRPIHTAFIAPMLKAMQRERWLARKNWEAATDLLLRQFFLELGRACLDPVVTGRDEKIQERMDSFRVLLQERCTEQWTLSSMAKMVHLSPSRFQVLYREMYGVSPVSDLIQMRLALAQHCLAMTIMPIKDVAMTCGFADIYYFSRQFKARVGMSPLAYRRRHGVAAT